MIPKRSSILRDALNIESERTKLDAFFNSSNRPTTEIKVRGKKYLVMSFRRFVKSHQQEEGR
jgi:hypothetical protein